MRKNMMVLIAILTVICLLSIPLSSLASEGKKTFLVHLDVTGYLKLLRNRRC